MTPINQNLTKFLLPLSILAVKYLLVSDKSCEEICNSKAFVDFATARRHRRLSNFYTKHNLYHHSKSGVNFELQNTYIVVFKGPRDLMQVKKLGEHLGSGS